LIRETTIDGYLDGGHLNSVYMWSIPYIG